MARIVLALVAGLVLTLPAHGRPISLSARDTAVRDILQLVARSAGLNLVCGPEVTGTTSVELKNVEAWDAIRTIAAMNGLAAGLSGSTVLVGSRSAVRSLTRTHVVRMIPVNHGDAVLIAQEVRRHYPGYAVTVHVPTNSIIVSEPAEPEPRDPPAIQDPPVVVTPPGIRRRPGSAPWEARGRDPVPPTPDGPLRAE